MVELNGAGGGGQLLRTALSLSACTGQPFRMAGIRAGRPRPGLMRQHLTAVEAVASICAADVEGATVASTELRFVPGAVRAGQYHFSIGTAGSTTLVLQTVLPVLLRASSASIVHLEGGTHNPMAPPADFIAEAFLPALRRMGASVDFELERHGFYPAGGGSIRVSVQPSSLQALMIEERGALKSVRARSLVSAVPASVAERELAVVARRLNLAPERLEHHAIRPAVGPGNVLSITIESEQLSEVISSFGVRGLSAEAVAERACKQALHYLDRGIVVGEHLADQLLLPMALAGAGRFVTGEPSEHLRTNADLIERFLPVRIRCEPTGTGAWFVEIATRSG